MPEPIRDDNPLKGKLTQEQFDAGVKFYEADHVLTDSERLLIAADLKSVLFKSTSLSYLAGFIGLITPTIIHNARNKTLTGIKKFTIFKPPLSVISGIFAINMTSPPLTSYYFNQKKQELASSGKTNQVNMFNVIDPLQTGVLFLYFQNSAKNPSIKIEDPRTITLEKLEEIKNHHRNPNHAQAKEAQARAAQNSANQWDQVRAKGFGNENRESGRARADDGLQSYDYGNTGTDHGSSGANYGGANYGVSGSDYGVSGLDPDILGDRPKYETKGTYWDQVTNKGNTNTPPVNYNQGKYDFYTEPRDQRSTDPYSFDNSSENEYDQKPSYNSDQGSPTRSRWDEIRNN